MCYLTIIEYKLLSTRLFATNADFFSFTNMNKRGLCPKCVERGEGWPQKPLLTARKSFSHEEK